MKCQLIAERCKRGDWVQWKEWSEVAFEETFDEVEMEGRGWELIDLPPDPRLKIPETDEFYDVMQDAATALAKNPYHDPFTKVQILREIYYNLQLAKVSQSLLSFAYTYGCMLIIIWKY